MTPEFSKLVTWSLSKVLSGDAPDFWNPESTVNPRWWAGRHDRYKWSQKKNLYMGENRWVIEIITPKWSYNPPAYNW